MSVSTSLLGSELHSTLHDRERRNLRLINKEDQLKARRYGMCEPGRNGRLKYTYNGYVLIWDPYTNRAITSWKLPLNERSTTGGTCRTDPVLIQKSLDHSSDYAESAHSLVSHQIRNRPDIWTSHTVLVVDMSGSMRTDDVDGARCRSDGVWTCLARDFVQQQVQEGKTSLTDLVSVVLMRDTAEVVIECEPTDYVLYNKLVDLREWTHHRPSGHGNYEPALEQAELLLSKNPSGSCAVSLLFFSDGRPSDLNKELIPGKMGSLASRFGRRLTVTCIGMANQRTEDFSILEIMVQEAKAFGAVAAFNKPSMDADSLSKIISSQFTSSLTSTKTELTNLSSGKTMTVRTDLIRERRNSPDDIAPTGDWRLFDGSAAHYTVNVWAWKHRDQGTFSRLIDPRCASCFLVHIMDNLNGGQAHHNRGMMCRSCKACFFCLDCIENRRAGRAHTRVECHKLATERRQGALLSLEESATVPTFNVAWKQQCFGEGAERVAFKFRYLDESGRFTGPKLVAKESRFVDSQGIESNAAQNYLTTHQHHYHKSFMQTQFLASKFATKYNETLEEWNHQLKYLGERYGYTKRTRDLLVRIRRFPRIRFLQPFIFELVDKDENKTFNVLVEPMIEGEYRKYNNNNGALVDMPAVAHQQFASPAQQNMNHGVLHPSLVKMLLGTKASDGSFSFSASDCSHTTDPQSGKKNNAVGGGLGAIVEEDSDDEEDESGDETDDDDNSHHLSGENCDDANSDNDIYDRIFQEGNKADRKLTEAHIPDKDFMQAFSHFSFVRSQGRMIVVDLQGTLQSIGGDGEREFVLTDPAIHSRKNSKVMKCMKFGRTDRGNKGISEFFSTHTCNDACRLLGVRPYKSKRSSMVSKQNSLQPNTVVTSKRDQHLDKPTLAKNPLSSF